MRKNITSFRARLGLAGAAVLSVLSGCSGPPEIYSHHNLIVSVSYDGAEREYRLPFRCEEDQGANGIQPGGPSTSEPGGYLFQSLPDGSGFAVGTPSICSYDEIKFGVAHAAARNEEPYSGDILIPPVAWLNDADRPTVTVHWASASAMMAASNGFTVKSARVATRSAPRRAVRARYPPGAQIMDGSCGVSFAISQAPRPSGMVRSETAGVYVSAGRPNFTDDRDFGTGGIAQSAAEFNDFRTMSTEVDADRIAMRERGAAVHPLTFDKKQGWTLTRSPDLVGRYIAYDLGWIDAKRHQAFSFEGLSLPLTRFRQIWIERDQMLLTPIGSCPHWTADKED